MKKRALLLTLGMLACLAQAEPALRDPTRPPDWQGADPAAGGGDGALRLEAVRRGGKGASLATINGTQLRVGQEIRDFKLISIGEAEVVLEGPEGRQVLRLAPAVERSAPSRGTAGGKTK